MEELIMFGKGAQELFPYVRDKAVVDFVNGLDAARELNAIQQQRLSLSSRILDGLSGKRTRRQADINDHLMEGLETCRSLFHEFSQDIQTHGVALLQLSGSVEKVQQSVATIADFTFDFKAEFNDFAAETCKDIADVKAELVSLEYIVLAEQEMNRWIDKWNAGRMSQLSPLARCYAVIDALYWGVFGNYLRSNKSNKTNKFIEHLRDKLAGCLRRDLGNIETTRDLIRDEWLRLPEQTDTEVQKALAYQGDWCLDSPKDFSTTFTATQWHTLPQDLRLEYQHIPFEMMDIERVVKRMLRDRFEG